MTIVLATAVIGLLLLAILLYRGQDGMIFHPRPYAAQELAQLRPGLIALRTPGGSLVAFYRAPAEGSIPQRVWLLFGGNGDQALRWDHFARTHAATGTGFLMLEYPGYGACAGVPGQASILAANEQALGLLAQHLGLPAADLEQRTCALGHSLGAAAALQYAARHPVGRLILISPFTTMKAMAARQVGWPLCELLVHRFDNLARLDEIAARSGLPPTTIFHGANDGLIPPEMSRALVAAHPAIRLQVLPGAGHNDVLDLGEREIDEAMRP